MLRLMTYAHEAFPPALNWQAVSFMRVEWPFIEGGRLRKPYPASLRPVHFALVDDDLLISYAAVVRLNIEHAGRSYRLAGLGNVFTFPSSRGAGHGGRVVRAATEHIDGGDADIAALFCDPALAGFYARSGWQAIAGAVTLTGPREAPRVHDALRMMRFISPAGRAGQAAFESQPLYLPHGW